MLSLIDHSLPFQIHGMQATMKDDDLKNLDNHLSLFMFSSMLSIEPCCRMSFKAVCPPIPVSSISKSINY